MKKVIAIVLAMLMVLSCSALAADQLGFLPPAMTSPFYAACIEGATPVATALGYELVIMAREAEEILQ